MCGSRSGTPPATRHITNRSMETPSTGAVSTRTGSAWGCRRIVTPSPPPSGDTLCTRRQRPDTPLQALVTMDDPQWVEASRALAQRLIEQGGKQPEQRIKYLSDLMLSHDPSPQMESVLQQSLRQMEQHYA